MGSRARALVALALAAVALAGCGSSNSPSALDPAHVVPGNAIAYLEATVRPQGAQRDAVESALTKLLGHSPDAAIQRGIHLPGLNYKRDIEPWLGQRIAFVATGLSLPGIAFIAPTNDPAAAVAAMARGERSRGRALTRATYDGIPYRQFAYRGAAGAVGAVGHYAVIGGTSAFKQIVDTYRGRIAPLKPAGSGALGRAYVNEPRAVAAVMALPTITAAERREIQAVFAQSRLPTSLTLTLSASPHAFTLDAHSSGAPIASANTAGTGDVRGLPGDSWLAISTGSAFAKYLTTGFDAGFLQGFSRAARTSGINAGALLDRFRRRTGIDLTRDLLPALGPFQLAVEGGALTTLQASLALYPTNPFAGGRLVADIHNIVARDHRLRVIGGPRSFRFGPTSVPFPIAGVADLGPKIVGRFSIAATHPATTKLSGNPAFARAHGQLPAGSTVPLFLDFGPLASLLSQTPQFKPGGSNHKALPVLRRLDYFLIGVNSAEHGMRIVLGLR